MKNNILSATVIAVAVVILGAFLYAGIVHFSDKDRAVTVKGLSTRDVEADFAVWPIDYSLSGDDLVQLYADLSALNGTVRKFLLGKGFDDADINQGTISVSDNWESYYGSRPKNHYTLHTSVVVSTKNVELVRNCNGSQSELLSRGIILNTNEWRLNYDFNGLNELKPVMVEEATKNARAVAQKFADDAECNLGSILSASQGQFSVESDSYQPWIKHVRVVTTVTYQLD